MHPIKHILVAIKTLDARSMPALRKAVQLAKANGASLELFHALSQTVLIEALDSRKVSLRQFEAEQSAKALRRLNTIAQRVRKHDVEVSCAVEWDYLAYEAIVRRALKTRCDLVVGERHASRSVAGWLLAYTDWELLRQAPCPVLLVKTAKPYHRPTILTAVDPFHEHAKPSRLDDALLAMSARLATALKGSLRIVHCVPSATLVAAGWASGPIVVDTGKTSQRLVQARKALAAEAARHPMPSHTLAVLEGAPREALPQAAHDYNASLVVMGAMSRSGLQRLLVGNTAEAVLDHLACDVLVIKPGAFKSRVPRRTRGAQLMALPSAMTG